MIFGYLYEKNIIKNNDRWFRIWCWLSFKKWYQTLLIPYHFFMGIRYGYKFKEIIKFCYDSFHRRETWTFLKEH
jgi:hypothetical protein